MRAFCILLLVLAACDKTPAEAGSCYRPQDNICLDYGAEQAAAGKRLCTGMKWSASPCTTENRLGTCAQKDAKPLYYSGAPNNYSAASAKSACEHANGAWSPSP